MKGWIRTDNLLISDLSYLFFFYDNRKKTLITKKKKNRKIKNQWNKIFATETKYSAAHNRRLHFKSYRKLFDFSFGYWWHTARSTHKHKYEWNVQYVQSLFFFFVFPDITFICSLFAHFYVISTIYFDTLQSHNYCEYQKQKNEINYVMNVPVEST